MVIGGLPLLALSILNHDPALSGSISNLSATDVSALVYTSVFGSAVSYGVYFYNATRGYILSCCCSFTLNIVPIFTIFVSVRNVEISSVWNNCKPV